MPYSYRCNLHFVYFPTILFKALDQAGASSQQTCDAMNCVISLYQLGMNLLNKRSGEPLMSFTQADFLPIRLTNEHKKDYVKWAAEHEVDMGVYLSELAASGHKMTLSHSDKTGAFICSITCRDKGSENYMKCISSYHEDSINAILVALYKHFVLLADILWDDAKSKDSWG